MKIRQSFVSNSSSSSFIVTFDKDPTELENLKEMMGACYAEEYSYSTENVISRVHMDVIKGKTASIPELVQEFENIVFEYKSTNGGVTDWAEIDRANREKAEIAVQQFIETRKGAFTYILEYCDDGGEAALEHGNIFRNLPHVRSSHH